MTPPREPESEAEYAAFDQIDDEPSEEELDREDEADFEDWHSRRYGLGTTYHGPGGDNLRSP